MMKIITVICEYNPFHLGHSYQLDTLREIFGQNSAIIAIMSGSMTQRGDVAVLDKYARARTAAACGCNLVLELPAPWSMAGAEFFARAGVSIAGRLGCAEILAFGSESGDIASLSQTARNLSNPYYVESLKRARLHTPDKQAGDLRAEVYSALFGKSDHFTGSNDLLALEYLRAIASLGVNLEPFTIKRVGERYNSEQVETNRVASATAIRKMMASGDDYRSQIPPQTVAMVENELAAGRYYRLANLNAAVTAFLRLGYEQMRGKMEVSGGIENRLHAASLRCADIDTLINRSLERRYSASRLRRAILGAMLGFTMRDCEELPRYTTVLAADAVGRELLAVMRKRAELPILTKPAAYHLLDLPAKRQFEHNLAADRLHALAAENDAERSPDLFARRAAMLGLE